MANKVVLKRSTVTGKVPLTTDLDYGELALNYTDGKLYFKTSSDSVQSFEYLSLATGVESWKYNGKTVSVGTQDTEPREVSFSADGTKMYILGNANNTIYQYTLSTAWDVSTATYATLSFSVGTQETTPTGIYFKSDGTTFWVVGQTADTVFKYTMSTPWAINTATYASVSFLVSGQETSSGGLTFSSDGTKMFLTGGTNDRVYQYNLGTAWDIATAVYSTFLSVSIEGDPQGIAFNNAGTKLYVIGGGSIRILEYTLSTAWSLSTATFTDVMGGVYYLDNTYTTTPSGCYYNETIGKFWISDYTNDRVFEFSTTTTSKKLAGLTTRVILEPELHVKKDIVVNNNARVLNGLSVHGNTILVGSTAINGTITTYGATNLGTFTGGGTVALGASNTISGSTKVLNIGTAGLSGSITTISIGSAVSGATGSIALNHATTVTGDLTLNNNLVFEGTTADAFETTLTVVNPTADRTITFPDATTTVVGTDTAQTLSNKTLSDGILSGTLTANGSTGTSGNVLISTGTGVAWQTNSIDTLTDVVISSPQAQQVLKYNGSTWINADNDTAVASAIFAAQAQSDLGYVYESVVFSEDLGFVYDTATFLYDLGQLRLDGIVSLNNLDQSVKADYIAYSIIFGF